MLHLTHPPSQIVAVEDRRQSEAPSWLAQADAQRRQRDQAFARRKAEETERQRNWAPQLDAVRRLHGQQRRLRP